MILGRLQAIGAACALALVASGAGAQTLPPPPSIAGPSMAPPQAQQNPVCSRLEAQLAAFDRGGDGGRTEQVRRYEEAVRSQQAEIDRTSEQARRTGCEGSGFFLFGRSQPPQCDDLNNRVQRMRTNLDRLNADLRQLQGGPSVAEGQRRQILAALGQNDCGPQYRTAAAPPRQRGFFETLFGGGGGGGGGAPTSPFGSGDMTPSDQTSTFRTICVRTCDGFYFPVSYSASASKFRDDEQACQRMCPASEVALYTYRNPGEDVPQAVSLAGQPYTSLANAFRYRQEFNPACSCRRPGETWAEALKEIQDTTVERGDIIVTDETAKAMAQPKTDAAKGKQAARGKNDPKGQAAAAGSPEPSATPAPVTSAPLPSTAEASPPTAPAPAAAPEQGKRSIRTVGPPFIVR